MKISIITQNNDNSDQLLNIMHKTTNRWTKLLRCNSCKPAAMSQPKFNSSPWLSNHSTFDCWPCMYVFRSPYTHTCSAQTAITEDNTHTCNCICESTINADMFWVSWRCVNKITEGNSSVCNSKCTRCHQQRHAAAAEVCRVRRWRCTATKCCRSCHGTACDFGVRNRRHRLCCT